MLVIDLRIAYDENGNKVITDTYSGDVLLNETLDSGDGVAIATYDIRIELPQPSPAKCTVHVPEPKAADEPDVTVTAVAD